MSEKTAIFRADRPYLLIFFVTFFLFTVLARAPAQTAEQSSRDFVLFITPLAEVIGYGRKNPSIGGGFAFGLDDGVAIGIRCLFAFEQDGEGVNTMEMTAMVRYYLRGLAAYTGPFVQLNLGPVLFAYQNAAFVPAEEGSFSVGLAFGWRFPLGNYWFIEPAVRAGYPYMYGAGLAIAFRL
jgi:hypothetical protein